MRLIRRRTLHFNTAVKEDKFKDILKILINCRQPFTDNYKDGPVFSQTFLDKGTPKITFQMARNTPPMETFNDK
jgi:hypothetical protein